jgi:hypothetical protein
VTKNRGVLNQLKSLKTNKVSRIACSRLVSILKEARNRGLLCKLSLGLQHFPLNSIECLGLLEFDSIFVRVLEKSGGLLCIFRLKKGKISKVQGSLQGS